MKNKIIATLTMALLAVSFLVPQNTAKASETTPTLPEVVYINSSTPDGYNYLIERLEDRKGKYFIVETVTGTVLDEREDGVKDGVQDNGYYIAYGAEYCVGDRIESKFIYGIATNYIDDIIGRQDSLIIESPLY